MTDPHLCLRYARTGARLIHSVSTGTKLAKGILILLHGHAQDAPCASLQLKAKNGPVIGTGAR
jgi:hypothetical protein